ncbi:MAG: metalloregulator ArsR/SmtB family transcription factor [Acidimicrobiia bacterium]|nr:metalloregulator ArsR/SmtB family transcription factor [Acidimicrobiia bacterium]
MSTVPPDTVPPDTDPPGTDPPTTCCALLLAEPLGEAEAESLAALLKALADPVRLRLVSIVAAAAGGEVCACDLPGALDRSQPTTSHHLSVLVRAGILEREQRGKWAWFRLRAERLAELAAALSAPAPGALT